MTSDPVEDSRLYALRADPPPAFADGLRESLRRTQAEAPVARRWAPARAAAVLLVMAGAAGLLSIPAVRASAQSFLALFRVVDFVAVPVSERGVAALKTIDLPGLVGEHVQVVGDDGPPVPVASAAEAGAVAGYEVRVPAWLPEGSTLLEAAVSKPRVVRVTADARRLEQVMDALGITDLAVPPGLDGKTLTVNVPASVMLRYEHGKRRTRFLQAPSPVVELPDVELEALGEIGLRVLGLSPDEARTMARGIDWKTTVLVQLPPTAQSFRRIDVNGHPGLAIGHVPPGQSPTNTILWSDGERVYALISLEGMSQLMQMALSVP